MTPLAFFKIGFGEMVVVGIVALLLFGGRLPDVMRTLGSTYRSFRRGFDDLSRQAMRPNLTAPPYTPIPPASTKPVPSNAKPSVPAPWSSPAATTAPLAAAAPAASAPASAPAAPEAAPVAAPPPAPTPRRGAWPRRTTTCRSCERALGGARNDAGRASRSRNATASVAVLEGLADLGLGAVEHALPRRVGRGVHDLHVLGEHALELRRLGDEEEEARAERGGERRAARGWAAPRRRTYACGRPTSGTTRCRWSTSGRSRRRAPSG